MVKIKEYKVLVIPTNKNGEMPQAWSFSQNTISFFPHLFPGSGGLVEPHIFNERMNTQAQPSIISAK